MKHSWSLDSSCPLPEQLNPYPFANSSIPLLLHLHVLLALQAYCSFSAYSVLKWRHPALLHNFLCFVPIFDYIISFLVLQVALRPPMSQAGSTMPSRMPSGLVIPPAAVSTATSMTAAVQVAVVAAALAPGVDLEAARS